MCRTTAFAGLAFSPCPGHDLALGARAAALRRFPILHSGLKLVFNPRTIGAEQFVPSNIVLGNNEWVFAADLMHQPLLQTKLAARRGSRTASTRCAR